MSLVLKTYLLQQKRKVGNLFKDHTLMVLVVLGTVAILLVASAIILKEMLVPSLEVINDIEEWRELSPIAASLAFSSSAIVAILYMIRMLIADGQDDVYQAMLANYNVPLLIRHGLDYLSNITYLIGLGFLLSAIMFWPSLMSLKAHQASLISILTLQLIWASCFIEAVLRLVHVISRYILQRWVSIAALAAALYVSYKHIQIVHPFNLMAFISIEVSIGLLLIFLVLLVFLTIYVLSFEGKKQRSNQTLVLFSFLPNTIWFKHFKETIRLKDFWFNTLLINAIIGLILIYKPELLDDFVVLKIIVVVPTMQAIYTYAQSKESVLIYQANKTSIGSIYLSSIISILIIYIIQIVLMGIYLSDIKTIFMGQVPLIILCLSLFKVIGLWFPLNYKDSKNQQIIISSLSLLLLPIVLIVIEVQKALKLTIGIINIIYLVIALVVQIIEYNTLKRDIYADQTE